VNLSTSKDRNFLGAMKIGVPLSKNSEVEIYGGAEYGKKFIDPDKKAKEMFAGKS